MCLFFRDWALAAGIVMAGTFLCSTAFICGPERFERWRQRGSECSMLRPASFAVAMIAHPAEGEAGLIGIGRLVPEDAPRGDSMSG